MGPRVFCVLLTLALAPHAGARQSYTRQVVRGIDRTLSGSLSSQCQATSTDSLSPAQVTGLAELPGAIRGELLKNLPLQVIGSSEHEKCLDEAAELLTARLRALCWMEASVTWTSDSQAGSPVSKLRFHVNLGARYQVGTIFIATDAKARTAPRLIIEEAQSALPANRACTASTLEDIWERVSRLESFREVWVSPGAPTGKGKRVVPLIIDVQEKGAPPR
jgi:hypothetical protein